MGYQQHQRILPEDTEVQYKAVEEKSTSSIEEPQDNNDSLDLSVLDDVTSNTSESQPHYLSQIFGQDEG